MDEQYLQRDGIHMRIAGLFTIVLAVSYTIALVFSYVTYTELYERKAQIHKAHKDWLGNYIEDVDRLSEDQLAAEIFKLKMDSSEFNSESTSMMESNRLSLARLGNYAPFQWLFVIVAFQPPTDALLEGHSLARQMLPGTSVTILLWAAGILLVVRSRDASKSKESTGAGEPGFVQQQTGG